MTNLLSKRKYKDIDVDILTIPQGTVLFRSMQSEGLIITDFVGFPSEISSSSTSTDYCLSPYHSVYFYLYPYIIDTNKHAVDENKMHMVMYVTTTDINVVLLLRPSPYTRHRDEKAPFFTECDKVEYCNTTGKAYDKCLLMDFMQENLDVCGMIGMQAADAVRFNKKWQEPSFEPFRKFVTYFYDAGNMKDKDNFGAPEIALYPRRLRDVTEIKTTLNDSTDLFKYVMNKQNEYNYIPFQSLYHKFLTPNDKLYKMLISMFSPRGFIEGGVVQHLTIDKRTYFYMLYEETPKKFHKYLVDIREPKKLPILQNRNPELIFRIISPFKWKRNVKFLQGLK